MMPNPTPYVQNYPQYNYGNMPCNNNNTRPYSHPMNLMNNGYYNNQQFQPHAERFQHSQNQQKDSKVYIYIYSKNAFAKT